MIHRLFEDAGSGLPFTLEVRISNREAIAMYEGLGFRSAGVRRRSCPVRTPRPASWRSWRALDQQGGNMHHKETLRS
jgi:hypothetical protein